MYMCIYISSWFTWPYCHCWTSCQAESYLGMTWPREVPKSKVKGSELDKKSLAGPWGLHSFKNGGFLRGTPSYHPSERRFWMGKAMAKKVSPCFRKHWLWACGSILRNPLAVRHHRFCGCLVGCSHQWHPCFAHLEPCLAKAALTQQLHALGTAKVSVMVSDILAAGLGSQVYTEIGDDGGLDHTESTNTIHKANFVGHRILCHEDGEGWRSEQDALRNCRVDPPLQLITLGFGTFSRHAVSRTLALVADYKL